MARAPSSEEVQEAQRLLAELEIKDSTICCYPGCHSPRRPAMNSGMRPAYCTDPKHTAQNNSRERKRLEQVAEGMPSVRLPPDQVANVGNIQSLQRELLTRQEQYLDLVGRYHAMISEMGDPSITTAQIEAAKSQADARVSQAFADLDAERAQRVAADQARGAAEEAARVAREDVDRLVEERDSARQTVILLGEEKEEAIAEVQKERDDTIRVVIDRTTKEIDDAIRVVIDRTTKEIADKEREKNEQIAEIQTHATEIQEKAQRATSEAHDTQTRAQVQVDNAKQRVTELQETFKKKQAEIARLRDELKDEKTAAKKREDEDRTEIARLRDELKDERTAAKKREDEDRIEIQALRGQVRDLTTRADALAREKDALSTQLLQSQMELQGKRNQ